MLDKKIDEERLTELQEELKAIPAEDRDPVYEETVADDAFNYVLILIPLFARPFVYNGFNLIGETTHLWGMWGVALFALLFAFVGRKRRSDELSAYWLGIVVAQIVAFPIVGTSSISSFFEGVLALFALGWIGRLISKNRHDNLFWAFATFLLVSHIVWTFGELILSRYIPLHMLFEMLPVRSAIWSVVMGIALGLFFIGRQRNTKWMGVFTLTLTTILPLFMLVLWEFSSFTLPTFLTLATMVLMTISVPAFFFWRDGKAREKQPTVS